jgi:NAD(P)-dependent dehydrogenase (short-subunit alcohol dehydrogenase family)
MSKTILITGTSSGFGKLAAISLAKGGHSVIAGMRHTKGGNAEVAKELSALNNIEVIELDVTNITSVNDAVEKIIKKYGAIDVLVNNAGVTGSGVVEATSVDIVKKLFEVNYFGVLRMYQAVLPSMRKHKHGLIINISSGLGVVSLPFLVPYSSSKFALEALTEGIRSELARFNIENVSVQCGPYPTGIMMKPGFNADKQSIVDEYGEESQAAFQKFGGTMFQKVAEFKMDPQAVADGIVKLVNMRLGTRPHQYPIDAIAKGLDQEMLDVRNTAVGKWLANYGFEV